MEEKGFATHNTAGGLLDMLRKAHLAVPGIYELKVLETWVGLRPATLDRKPLIQKDERGVWHVNGLFRHGIMLGPWAGRESTSSIAVKEPAIPQSNTSTSPPKALA